MTKSKWQLLLSIFAIFAIMAIAASCGDDDDDDDVGSSPTSGNGGTTPTVSTAAPTGAITIRTIQFESWDPHFSDFNQDIEHMFMVWRGLYHLDKDSKPQPAMADGMPTISADGLTYTVKLKKDLKWSDGDALDAADFVMGIQRTCNPDNAGHYQYILTAIVGCDDYYGAADKSADEKAKLQAAVGVKAVDATTLEFKLSDPQPTFTILLALWPTFPAPSHKLATVDAKWPDPMNNVYNGPFKPSEYTEKDHMTMVPNDQYNAGQKAQVSKLTLRYIDDPAVALNAYRAGEIDATAVPSTQLTAVRADPTLKKELVDYAATRTTGIEPNLKDPTLSKLEVRLALSQATDRKTLNDTVLNGANIPSTNWMPPDRSGNKAGIFDDAIGFNPDKAKANMKKAGYENGAGFPKITVLQTDSATNKAIGEFLQSQWKSILGIEINLEYTDSKTRSSRFNSGDFQIVLGGWGEDYPDPENWILGLYETGGSINKQHCSMKEIDDVIAKARFNKNDEQRRQEYRDAEKLIVENVCGMAPMWQVGLHSVVKPYIKGMIENKKPDDKQVPGDTSVELWTTSKK